MINMIIYSVSVCWPAGLYPVKSNKSCLIKSEGSNIPYTQEADKDSIQMPDRWLPGWL